MMRRPPATRRGFVLPMTLILIVLVAVAMAKTARQSFSKALQAKTAADDLQRRWGMRSIRAAVLPQAERILSDTEARTQEPAPSASTSLRLGELDFQITVSDEMAKLNINKLFATHRGKRQGVGRILSDLIHEARGKSARTAAKIRLLPYPPADANQRNSAPTMPFRTFGQVFDPAPVERLAQASQWISCWGDGRIHFARTKDRIMRQATRKLLQPSHVDRLLAVREAILRDRRSRVDEENPFTLPEVREAIAELQLDRPARQRLMSLLVDKSSCHGLWIVANSKRRTWHEFAVSNLNAANRASTHRSTWTP